MLKLYNFPPSAFTYTSCPYPCPHYAPFSRSLKGHCAHINPHTLYIDLHVANRAQNQFSKTVGWLLLTVNQLGFSLTSVQALYVYRPRNRVSRLQQAKSSGRPEVCEGFIWQKFAKGQNLSLISVKTFEASNINHNWVGFLIGLRTKPRITDLIDSWGIEVTWCEI